MAKPIPAPGLTFHPSRDDPTALTTFLCSVIRRYEDQKHTTGILEAQGVSSNTTGGTGGTTNVQEQLLGAAGVVPMSRLIHHPNAQETSKKRKASNLAPPPHFDSMANIPPRNVAYPALPVPAVPGTRSPDTTHNTAETKEKTRVAKRQAQPKKKAVVPVKLSTATRCSLMRAKQAIETRAPDPEWEAPPDETEVQKRRRLERINGRRKRTKKLIEIDQLHQQVGDLTHRNDHLKTNNDALRQARDALRQALLLRDGNTGGAECIQTAVAVASKALQSSAMEPFSTEGVKGDTKIVKVAGEPDTPHRKHQSRLRQEKECPPRLVPQKLLLQQQLELRMPASTLRAPSSHSRLAPPVQQHVAQSLPVSHRDLLRSSLALQQQQQSNLSTTTRMMALNQSRHQHKTHDMEVGQSRAFLRRPTGNLSSVLPHVSRHVDGMPQDAAMGSSQHPIQGFAAQLSELGATPSANSGPPPVNRSGSIESMLLQHVALMRSIAPSQRAQTSIRNPRSGEGRKPAL